MVAVNKTALQFSGLATYANPLGSQVQPGSMLLAQNIRLDKPGSVTPRPGESIVPMYTTVSAPSAGIPVTASVASWNQLYSAGERLLPSYTDSTGAWVPFSITLNQIGSVSTPSLPYAAPMGASASYYSQNVATPTARGLQWGQAVLTNLAGGITRVVPGADNSGASQTNYTVAHAAGLPPPGPPVASIVNPYVGFSPTTTLASPIPSAGSAVALESVYAYRALYARADTNGVQSLGPPSGRAEIANSSETAPSNATFGYLGSDPIVSTGLLANFQSANGQLGTHQLTFLSNYSTSATISANTAAPVIVVQGSSSQQGAVAMYAAGSPINLDPGEALVYFGTVSTAVNIFVPMQITGTSVSGSNTIFTAAFQGTNANANALTKLFQVGTAVTPGIAVFDTKGVGDPTTWQSTAPSILTPTIAVTATTVTFTSPTNTTFLIGDTIALLAPGKIAAPQTPWVSYFYKLGTPSPSIAPAVGDTLTLNGSAVRPQVTVASQAKVVDTTNGWTYLYLSLTAFPVGWIAGTNEQWPSLSLTNAQDVVGAYPLSANNSFSGPRNVSIQTPYDQWLHALAHEITTFTGEPTGTTPVSLYYYQLYRSVAQPIVAGVEFEASDNLQLVDQQNLDTGVPSGTTSQITLVDQSPDAVLGAEIYTAPNSGTAVIAQYAPPAAADLTLANNVALYANFSIPASASLQLVAVSPSSASTSTTKLPQLQPGDVISITYTPPTSESPITATFTTGTDFALVTNAGSASANINGTVVALCTAINNRGIYTPMTGMIVATPVSTFATSPGSFIIQCSMGMATFTLTWGPAITGNLNPFTGWKATNAPSVQNSQVAFALASQPEAVPLLNTIQVGTTTYPIRRALTCQGGTFLFKDDGIYSLTGVYGNYGVQLISNTARLVAENSAVSMQDSVVALTTEGVVLLSASGLQILSQAIHDEIFQLIAQPNINKAFAVVDQAKSHYLLWLCSGPSVASPDICYVYNILTNNWSIDNSARQAGQVNVGDGVLYTAAGPNIEPVLYPLVSGGGTYPVIYQKFDYGATPPQYAMADEVIPAGNMLAGSSPTQGVFMYTYNGALDAATQSSLSEAFVSTYSDGCVFIHADADTGQPATTARIESVDSVTFSTVSEGEGSFAQQTAVLVGYTVWPDQTSQLNTIITGGGANYIGAAIPTSFKVLMAGDDAGHVKMFQEYTLQARNTSQLWWTANLETDYGFSNDAIVLQGFNPGNVYTPGTTVPGNAQGWGSFEWGAGAWGGEAATWSNVENFTTTIDYATARSFVQRDTARGHVLFAQFSAKCAGTTYELIGLGFNWLSTNTTMQR